MNPYLAIALSVVMHVGWNLLARQVDGRCRFLWWGLLGHLLLLGPWSLWSLVEQAQWSRRLAGLMGISAISNAVYFLLLQKAYSHAPVALVYPVARSSPLLIAVWGLTLWGNNPPATAWSGIIVVVAGLIMLAWSGRNHHSGRALPWALGAALCTSIYALSDKAAVEALPGLASQLGFITVGYFVSFAALSMLQRLTEGVWRPPCRPKARPLLAGSLFIGTAYALVISAMQTLPASYAVAYTNAGIIIATLSSICFFKERHAWKLRLLGALVITGGLAVLSQAPVPSALDTGPV